MADHSDEASCIQLTASIVSAYVSGNTVSGAEIPALISQVYSALKRVSTVTAVAAPAEPPKPAVPIKRHLRTQYQMTPEQYRAKWNLPADYPIVAPNIAVRSQLAKQMGLGHGPFRCEVR